MSKSMEEIFVNCFEQSSEPKAGPSDTELESTEYEAGTSSQSSPLDFDIKRVKKEKIHGTKIEKLKSKVKKSIVGLAERTELDERDLLLVSFGRIMRGFTPIEQWKLESDFANAIFQAKLRHIKSEQQKLPQLKQESTESSMDCSLEDDVQIIEEDPIVYDLTDSP